MQRRHHYEQAFEEYLRARRIPYVAVDEARKALLPRGPVATVRTPEDIGTAASLKSFDFMIYGQGTNLLVEVKGRQVKHRARPTPERAPKLFAAPVRLTTGRLESWVTLEDVQSLQRWEGLFGPEFQAAFIFVYWCESQPPDALFQEVFEHRDRWYALRAVKVRDYARVMKVRSPKWRTVNVPTALFEQVSSPFAPDWAQGDGRGGLRGLELPVFETLVVGTCAGETVSG
jgi:hypothetical protein